MNNNHTVIAFDFGTKCIGIAIGQHITNTASPLTEVKNTSAGKPNWLKIKHIYNEWQPYLTIVGLPLNIYGREQKTSHLAREFAKNLFNIFKIKVIMHDERFSTKQARTDIFEKKGHRAIKENKINAISAAIILNSWLTQKSINTLNEKIK